MKTVKIGERIVGDGQPCYIVAEVGINHNGDTGEALRLINEAAKAGCDAVKFQKRTVDIVYSPEDLARPRESPFGTTNGDLKRGLELCGDAYRRIAIKSRECRVAWFASCWDSGSVDFIERFNPPCYKIASACLTDLELIRKTCDQGKPVILSTGMSELWEIDAAVNVIKSMGNPLIVLHCTSTYPSKLEELNLSAMETLRRRYDVLVGYSGHETGLQTTLAAAVMGACVVERHFTADRAQWGTDHAASVEPQGMAHLVRDIRACEIARGDGVKRVCESELPIKAKLRRVDTVNA